MFALSKTSIPFSGFLEPRITILSDIWPPPIMIQDLAGRVVTQETNISWFLDQAKVDQGNQENQEILKVIFLVSWIFCQLATH